jgi:hypothetical protein
VDDPFAAEEAEAKRNASKVRAAVEHVADPFEKPVASKSIAPKKP